MKISSIASLFLYATSLSMVQAVNDITFLHINDHHSHFEELSFDIRDPAFLPPNLSVNTTNVRIYYGGFPRVAGLINLRESESSNVVKLHAGDALTGTVFYTFFGPEMDAAAMNAVGFDAFVLGNHEFDDAPFCDTFYSCPDLDA